MLFLYYRNDNITDLIISWQADFFLHDWKVIRFSIGRLKDHHTRQTVSQIWDERFLEWRVERRQITGRIVHPQVTWNLVRPLQLGMNPNGLAWIHQVPPTDAVTGEGSRWKWICLHPCYNSSSTISHYIPAYRNLETRSNTPIHVFPPIFLCMFFLFW